MTDSVSSRLCRLSFLTHFVIELWVVKMKARDHISKQMEGLNPQSECSSMTWPRWRLAALVNKRSIVEEHVTHYIIYILSTYHTITHFLVYDGKELK